MHGIKALIAALKAPIRRQKNLIRTENVPMRRGCPKGEQTSLNGKRIATRRQKSPLRWMLFQYALFQHKQYEILIWKVALALHQNNSLLQAHVIKFSTAVTTNQRKTKFDRQNKVRWCRAIPFQHFPKEKLNVIFKNARISIPTTRVFGKYPRVRQIGKAVFLETWKMNSMGKC